MTQFSNGSWVDVQSTDSAMRERAFIRGVFGWMFGGLLLTALAAVWVAMSVPMQQIVLHNPAVFFGLIIAEFAAVLFLSFRIRTMSPGVAAGLFFAYSVLNGLTLSFIFFAYTQAVIFQAFVTAAGMFGAMAIYGLVTKRNLMSWGSFFFMGLIGIVIASVVNIFLHSAAISWMVSVIGVFVFVGLTAYDTQKLKQYATVSGPQSTNYAVIGALALYLDFVNLFLMLLRLFGGNRRQ